MTNRFVRKYQRDLAQHRKEIEAENPRRPFVKTVKPHVEDHNGQQEQDRRKRQIERGQLREQNGLLVA